MAQLVKTVAGLAIASVKTVDGLAIASVSTVNGLDNTSAGGGGFALVNHLEYSPNNGSLTSGTLNCTGANLIVVFVGTYKDWYASAFTDSNLNIYTAGTRYAGSTQAGQYWYCVNPAGTLSALTFTATGIDPNIKFYTLYGIQAFSGGATATIDQQSGAQDNTDPLQPGSITPSANNCLVVSGIFNYNAGASPTCNSSFTYYGVAKSSNIGMGGAGWLVQGSASAVNPTWTSAGAAGSGENAVIQASFKP